MIVTDYFVYIHTSRHAGTFINRLIMENVSGAQMLRYHGQLKHLPPQFKHLPVIGFVRNPWDWYISMYFDYQSKNQYIYEIVSEGGKADINETLKRFVQLGNDESDATHTRKLLFQAAPKDLNQTQPMRYLMPGLTKNDFAQYPQNVGYYSWLYKNMHEINNNLVGNIGRFENLRKELLRLFEETNTPISSKMSKYINDQKPVNSSSRDKSYAQYYTDELVELIAKKDQWIIDQYHYKF